MQQKEYGIFFSSLLFCISNDRQREWRKPRGYIQKIEGNNKGKIINVFLIFNYSTFEGTDWPARLNRGTRDYSMRYRMQAIVYFHA